ncbi:MAG: TolC family protein [Nitrospirae bacterium]|nr:TolC family protein [Nitrospirota bacterium]
MKKIPLVLFAVSFITYTFAYFSYAEVLTLPEGLRLATENNRSIKISGQEELISEADTLIAKSYMLPRVNASLSRTFLSEQPGAIFGNQEVFTAEKDFLSYSLSVQQTLYDFRKNAARYEASRTVLNTRRLDTVMVRNLVALDFVSGYFDLLEADKMVIVAQKEVEQLELHHRNAETLYDGGVITKNELLQAQVRISDAKQRLLSAGNMRALTASRLNNIVSRPLKTDIQVADVNGPSYDISVMELEDAWQTSERLRPEIGIVDETVNALELEKTSRRSEYFPEFFARGGYDYTENEFQLHEGNWSLVLGMHVNLFNGRATSAEILKLGHKREKLIEQKNKLLEEIRLEVERYVLDAKTAREKIGVTENAVQQAEENLRINRIRYEEGVGTATDVLDAVTLLTTAETNYYRAVYELRKAEAGVIYSTGQELSEVYK